MFGILFKDLPFLAGLPAYEVQRKTLAKSPFSKRGPRALYGAATARTARRPSHLLQYPTLL
jgi:hypothetical protein